MYERGSSGHWFPVEFLIFYDYRNKVTGFAYVRKEDDGGDIPDGYYVFEDNLGEETHRWRKWEGKWQVGWRYRATERR